jgi:hypothetical protein
MVKIAAGLPICQSRHAAAMTDFKKVKDFALLIPWCRMLKALLILSFVFCDSLCDVVYNKYTAVQCPCPTKLHQTPFGPCQTAFRHDQTKKPPVTGRLQKHRCSQTQQQAHCLCGAGPICLTPKGQYSYMSNMVSMYITHCVDGTLEVPALQIHCPPVFLSQEPVTYPLLAS